MLRSGGEKTISALGAPGYAHACMGSGGLKALSNREKTLLIDALREHYGLPELLAQLDLARSSYFCHRARAAVGDKYLQVRQAITDIFESNHRCYGYRRLQASLTRQGVAISEKVV